MTQQTTAPSDEKTRTNEEQLLELLEKRDLKGFEEFLAKNRVNFERSPRGSMSIFSCIFFDMKRSREIAYMRAVLECGQFNLDKYQDRQESVQGRAMIPSDCLLIAVCQNIKKQGMTELFSLIVDKQSVDLNRMYGGTSPLTELCLQGSWKEAEALLLKARSLDREIKVDGALLLTIAGRVSADINNQIPINWGTIREIFEFILRHMQDPTELLRQAAPAMELLQADPVRRLAVLSRTKLREGEEVTKEIKHRVLRTEEAFQKFDDTLSEVYFSRYEGEIKKGLELVVKEETPLTQKTLFPLIMGYLVYSVSGKFPRLLQSDATSAALVKKIRESKTATPEGDLRLLYLVVAQASHAEELFGDGSSITLATDPESAGARSTPKRKEAKIAPQLDDGTIRIFRTDVSGEFAIVFPNERARDAALKKLGPPAQVPIFGTKEDSFGRNPERLVPVTYEGANNCVYINAYVPRGGKAHQEIASNLGTVQLRNNLIAVLGIKGSPERPVGTTGQGVVSFGSIARIYNGWNIETGSDQSTGIYFQAKYFQNGGFLTITDGKMAPSSAPTDAPKKEIKSGFFSKFFSLSPKEPPESTLSSTSSSSSMSMSSTS